jgi:hypothetical protein
MRTARQANSAGIFRFWLRQFGGPVSFGVSRARDLDIAEPLGFGRPRDIRKIIDRHAAELEAFGTRATVARVIKGERGSTTSTEYWLNEEQALLVSVLSDAQNATAVRAMLIKVFVAWRRNWDQNAFRRFGGQSSISAAPDSSRPKAYRRND